MMKKQESGDSMNLYFAPLEGIGGYIYRNAQAEYFGGADKYFSPFLAPNRNRSISPKEYKDISPEHNANIRLVPQIMANNADIFVCAARELEMMGYREINLNLGCPSRTVVTKCRGAGFLAKPEALEHFLEEVYGQINIKLSIKTRIGLEEEEEFIHLLEIYNRFPVEELIIHPRVQTDYYRNMPHMDAFWKALQKSVNPVVYNGDIFDAGCYETFCDSVKHFASAGNASASQGYAKGLTAVMCGRGVLANPALFEEIRGSGRLTKERFREFHDRLLADYTQVLSGDRNVLFRMKELWFYMARSFTNSASYEKKIRKAQHLDEYRLIVRKLLAEQEIRHGDIAPSFRI